MGGKMGQELVITGCQVGGRWLPIGHAFCYDGGEVRHRFGVLLAVVMLAPFLLDDFDVVLQLLK